jgi:hypothetical protein
MEKFNKQGRVSVYSGNCAKFTVGIVVDRTGVGVVVWGGSGNVRGHFVGRKITFIQ